MGVQVYKCMGVQGIMVVYGCTSVRVYKCKDVQGCTSVQVYKCLGVQCIGVQIYRCTGVWVYRCTKYMDLEVYKMYGCTFG